MNKLLIIFLSYGFSISTCLAQNNTFPLNGNVGIGTLNPSYGKLSINYNPGVLNASADNTFLALEDASYSTNGIIKSRISWINANGLRISSIFAYHNAYNSNRSDLVFETATTSSSQERMRITADGNIGIGTASPLALLDIQGGGINIGKQSTSLDATLHIKTSYGGFDRLTQISPSEVNKPALNLMAAKDASNNDLWWAWGVQTSGVYAFQPSSAFGGNTGMFLKRNGNVGIGIIDPSEALAVNGLVRAKEIKVETSNWPDFVFAKQYQLVSLPDLEKFIAQNKHLPEIPSAAEAEKSGVGLGEMNSKLLQKIEELTLYLIEQGKEIEKLKSQMSQVNERKQSASTKKD